MFSKLCATLGTTGACAFDNLQELGPICQVRNSMRGLFIYYKFLGFVHVLRISVRRSNCGFMWMQPMLARPLCAQSSESG